MVLGEKLLVLERFIFSFLGGSRLFFRGKSILEVRRFKRRGWVLGLVFLMVFYLVV